MKELWQKIKTEFLLKPRLNPRFLIFGLVLLVAVLALGSAVYFFTKTRETKQVLSEQSGQKSQSQPPLEVSSEEADSLYSMVNKIMLLPDEKPKISTVKGADKLKAEPFFRNARDGDKVLVFEESKRAILYNPTEHRVIEVGKAELSKPASAQSATPSASLTKSQKISQSKDLNEKSITVNETGIGYLRVRENPDTDSSELGRVSPGRSFSVFDEEDGWYKIEYAPGEYGWVSGTYVSLD